MTGAIDEEGQGQGLYNADLQKKTRTSIFWTLVRIMSDQVFSFAVFVILARLLSPREIGIFAIAYAFSEIGRIIATGGTVQSIARANIVTATLADTVFWTNLGLALLMALAALTLAPIALRSINQPDAAQLLQVLGLVLPIIALGATHMAMRLREFGHKSLALRSVASGTIGGAAAVGAAFAGWGVWSLVVQRFVSEIVNTIMSWGAFRWTPSWNFSLTQLREIAGFGANVTLTQVIFMLLVRVQDLIVGAMISAAAVGIYRTAWRTTELIANGTIQSFTTVALQTMSRLQDDRNGLIRAYRWMLSTSAFISFPALVGFGVLAPDAVPAIYGAKWVEAGELAQVFAFMVVPFALNYFTSAPLTALGRGANMRTLSIAQLVLTICLTLLAAPYGIFAVAWAYVGRAYIMLPMQMWYLQRGTGITVRDTLSAVAAPFFASAIMGVAVWALMFLLRPHISNMLVAIAVGVAAGVVIYGVALLALSAQARSVARGQWKGHALKKPAQ